MTGSGARSRRKGARAERPQGEWRPVSGHSGYWVCRDGRVWSDKSGRLLRGLVSRDGYLKIHLAGGASGDKQRFVHRLVAEAFLSGSGEQVRHMDGDKKNNAAENLEWGSCRDNILDKWKHGRMPHGEGHHANKIPLSAIPEIRASTKSSAELGRIYGVSRSAIYNIRAGKSYAWMGVAE